MMYQISTLTAQGIKDFDAANGNVLGGDIYPLVAPLKAKGVFAVYRVSKTTPFSKEGFQDIRVEIVLVGEDYEALCQYADALEDDFTAKEGFNYESTIPGVNPDKPEEIQITISYNLKMTI